MQHLCNRVAFINHGIIESVENVLDESMDTNTDIICLKLLQEIDINKLLSIEYINSARKTDDGIEIILLSNKTPELIKYLVNNNYAIQEVFKIRKGLEQRYMELVEGGIR